MSQVEIGNMLAQYQAGFNLLGRLCVLQHATARVRKPLRLATHSSLQTFAGGTGDAVMRVDFDLPSKGAIDYLRNLTPVTRSVFDGLVRQYKNDAFTIAGVSDVQIIGKVRDALAQILTDGGTSVDLRGEVDHLTDQAQVERLSSTSIDTVFNTNIQKAYSAGRYEQMTEESVADALPYWQYWTVGDGHVRPEHRALDQFVARQIDTVWRKIYPPCGYRCRCSAVALTEEEALAADKNAGDPGFMRLPEIAKQKVPQPGFTNIFGV